MGRIRPGGDQLRYLDDVLWKASKAGMRLVTPWEESDAGED